MFIKDSDRKNKKTEVFTHTQHKVEKSKSLCYDFFRTLGKYYIADIGLRDYLLCFRDMDTGHCIENIVCFELLRRGYDVAVGKIDNKEVDFIATNANEKIYIQVTESMNNTTTRERELTPLRKIRDNYEKIVIAGECKQPVS